MKIQENQEDLRRSALELRSPSRSDSSAGGCIFVFSASVELESVVLSDCRAATGAGISVIGSQVKISGSIFFHNGMASTDGTVLQGAAGSFENSDTLIKNCTFDSNFWSVTNAIINGGALSFLACNVTLSGSSSFARGNITKTHGGIIHGGNIC